MDFCDSPWFLAIWAFCFAEDTFFCQQNLITNFVFIVDLLTVFVSCVKISLVLPVFFYFVPVRYERNVKEHVPSKYCCAWRGFKDCMKSEWPMRHCQGRNQHDWGLLSWPCQVQLCITSVLGLDVSIPKSHLLVDSLAWLAYAL
jgi:hypothetical protein